MSAWDALARLLSAEAAMQARWVVVDCETSGLDAARDRLLSIGAVAVRAARIRAHEAYEATVAQAVPSSRDNILVHGIGEARQRSGRPEAEVLDEFARFAGEAPCAAFRAPFDRAVLSAAARRAGIRLPRRWLDLAELLPVLFPARGTREATLDAWLASFAIRHAARHDALADAYATAQLLLVALDEARRQGFASVRQVLGGARAAPWAAARA